MREMKASQLRKLFLEFFEKKDHQIWPSSPLIPADNTTLFTTAGVQQFIPFISGKVKPPKPRAASVQKCLRTDDIGEVGDKTHHTFFEMLGNWSFGDYFKKEAIEYAWEFLTQVCEIPPERLVVTIFKGEQGIPKDEEARRYWLEVGVPESKIFELGMKDNFWGPVGDTGPCGPCTEIHFDKTDEPCEKGKECDVECECGRFVEVWNLVFMEFNKTKGGNYEPLPQKNVDTGIGFERLLAILQKKDSAYETDLFWPVIELIQEKASQSFEQTPRFYRIIADHLRATVFLVSEGLLPSNVERGYILRMLLRRLLTYAFKLDLEGVWYEEPVKKFVELYSADYPELKGKGALVIQVVSQEKERFSRTLEKGLRHLEKLILETKEQGERILDGRRVFDLYQSYGFPKELTKDLAMREGLSIDEEGYKQALREHKEKSRAGAKKKFGGIGIDEIEDPQERYKATKLHTATHLLQAALRQVLGEHVRQMGSDITPERLRFDFSHPSKLSDTELQRIEDLVNQKIQEGLKVIREEKPYKEAIGEGALAFFKEKYPEVVSVYTIQNEQGEVFSKELCWGPHVSNTKELGRFRIIKEQGVGTGIRRIIAVVE